MSNINKFAAYALTGFFFVSSTVAENKGLSKENLSIEIMAAYSIQYGVVVCESEDDETKRAHVAKRIVSMIFFYWYSAHIQGGYASSKVDEMIKQLPKNTYEDPDLGVLFEGYLRDPLGLLGDGERLVVDSKYNITSKSEYLLLLKSFSTFLEE